MNIYILSITEKDEKHIPEILRLSKKFNADNLPFSIKDGKGYQFEFSNDADRIAFKDEIEKLGMYRPED